MRLAPPLPLETGHCSHQSPVAWPVSPASDSNPKQDPRAGLGVRVAWEQEGFAHINASEEVDQLQKFRLAHTPTRRRAEH